MSKKKQDPEVARIYAWWLLRILLSAGGIWLYAIGKDSGAETCGILVFLTFVFGDV